MLRSLTRGLGAGFGFGVGSEVGKGFMQNLGKQGDPQSSPPNIGANSGIKCTNCGAAGVEGQKFCGSCGGKLEPPVSIAEGMACAGCGTVNDGTRKFCKECGSELKLEG